MASSHYDSNAVTPGADDDISATAALLEAARMLAGTPLPATVVFASFTGEEAGLLGSREFVRLATLNKWNIVGALNNDMIGWGADSARMDNTIRYSNPGIRDVQHGAAFLFTDLILYDAKYYKSTDAQAFYDGWGDVVGGLGSYPVLANPNYHQPSDLIETVNFRQILETAKVTAATLVQLASSPSRLKDLMATRTGTGVDVTWTPSPEAGVRSYVVAYGPPADPLKTRVTVTSAKAALPTLPAGTQVAVKAVNARGMEGWDWARVTIEVGAMAFEDLPLDRPPGPRRVPVRSATSRWVILAAGTVIAAALLAFWWMGRAQPPPAMTAPTSPTDAARPPGRPQKQLMELPPLADSDPVLRGLFATLSKHPLLARVVAQRGIVRAATLAVVQIGDGKTPVLPLSVLRPAERLTLVGRAPSGRIDPASYARWNGAVGALLSVNAADAAQIYVNVKPLFDEAYHELGYPDGDFDEAIVRAIRTLNGTPDLAADPVLLARPAYFEHEDAALRSLLPVQKQLLLTGPEHRRQVLAWLRQFAAALELKID